MFFKAQPKSNHATAPQNTTIAQGAAAEQRAEHYLQQQGLTTREKNYRAKQGEIDLIMMQGDEIVFVEVRLRRNSQFANAAESVTISKQKKIIKTAQQYLQQHRLTETANCRFDVIAFSDAHSNPEWIQNAFSAY